ncbi:MAG: GxxExxY protein [Candidatus Auribacterota bacterium]|nr:GxxExxY protein [Candidatus Auribacterota bacterium]
MKDNGNYKPLSQREEEIGKKIVDHLKLTGRRLGYLINFNVSLIKKGIKRMVL